MIGLDTNVLVRYLTQDDARQAAAATRFIETRLSERTPGFISLVVLVELCWVLERLYSASPQEIAGTVGDLLETPRFQIQQRDAALAALELVRGKRAARSGFADALIAKLAQLEGCSAIVSFDKAAVRSSGMTLLS